MKTKKNNNSEITQSEFKDLFTNLINSHEDLRQATANDVENDIALPLIIMKHNITKDLKEAKLLGQSTKNYESYLKEIDEILGGIRPIYTELYPSFLGIVDLEMYLRGFSKEHSHQTAIPVHFNSEVSKERLNLYSKPEKLNIYRIYKSCEIYLISSMKAADLDVSISEVGDEIFMKFVVNRASLELKEKKTEAVNEESFVKEIMARLIYSGGHIDRTTDWIHNIKLFFPLPAPKNNVLMN